MAAAFKPGGQPLVNDHFRQFAAYDEVTEGQNIGIVMLAGEFGRLGNFINDIDPLGFKVADDLRR